MKRDRHKTQVLAPIGVYFLLEFMHEYIVNQTHLFLTFLHIMHKIVSHRGRQVTGPSPPFEFSETPEDKPFFGLYQPFGPYTRALKKCSSKNPLIGSLRLAALQHI